VIGIEQLTDELKSASCAMNIARRTRRTVSYNTLVYWLGSPVSDGRVRIRVSYRWVGYRLRALNCSVNLFWNLGSWVRV